MYATQFDLDRMKALEIAGAMGLREDQALRAVQSVRIACARNARRLQSSNWIK